MRGGAQAFLLECDDLHYYVVKVRNNPQHRRVLVNEWIASGLLNRLVISAPLVALVNISEAFLEETPNLTIALGSRNAPVELGAHFGSQYPGDPCKTRVYDFIPDILLHPDHVVNFKELTGVLAFDKWIGNGDVRQAIFTRLPGITGSSVRQKFTALMIDNGYAFGGPQWTFCDSPLQGFYFRPAIYRLVTSTADFQPWLERIMEISEGVLQRLRAEIPPEWLLPNDEFMLDQLLARLLSRRRLVPELIADALHARCNPFPNWAGTLQTG